MNIVIWVFILVGGSIAFSAWKNSRRSAPAPAAERDNDHDRSAVIRTCASCGYTGEMKTWLAHYTAPKIITVAGFLLGYIPGLVFLAMYWGKYKCPNCRAVGRNKGVGTA